MAELLISISDGSPVPEEAGFVSPPTAARVHEKMVPDNPLVGVEENNVLLHIAGGVRMLVNVGRGLTVTWTS